MVKFALHTNGHTWISGTPTSPSPGMSTRNEATHNENRAVSTPRTSRTHGDLGTRVPAEVLKTLHGHLRQAYPELGALPLDTTRLCWYLDTPDENWVIDEVADHSSLFIATGGSGHAFKV